MDNTSDERNQCLLYFWSVCANDYRRKLLKVLIFIDPINRGPESLPLHTHYVQGCMSDCLYQGQRSESTLLNERGNAVRGLNEAAATSAEGP